MASIIKASIDVNKIPKDKIFVGKKGKYLPITITINDELDQFGNQGPVVVEQTKEERDAKAAKTYLGNVKVVWTNGNNVEPAPRDNASAAPQLKPQEEDLPFQMSKEEINGFLVDKFNQHSLKEGATQGICPLCSSDRKPKNTKAQCASYDWERGLGTCHNCDTTFQLHTYQRKGASERVYVRPDTPEQFKEISTNVETWFGTRGISKKTLQELQVTEGQEWMPQTSKMENTIQFNYFMGDQLINVNTEMVERISNYIKALKKYFIILIVLQDTIGA